MPAGKPDVWRLWWSFTWRQALVMTLAAAALGVFVVLLKRLGLPPRFILGAMPYMTLGLVSYSGYEASRRLMIVYDIRFPGGQDREQDHRHRR